MAAGIKFKTSANSTTSVSAYKLSSNTFRTSRRRSGSGPCNETKKHNNEQKALFHGLKSAYRNSRSFDGEYGVDGAVPFETAAGIAAEVAIAFFRTTDHEYTREESRAYIDDQFAERNSYVDLLFGRSRPLDDRFGAEQFEEAMGHAWTQVDDKWNHYDAARTALAAAEAYLGIEYPEVGA